MAADKPDCLPPEDLEDLYENAPCAYLSLGPDGRIVKCNATLSAWLGIPSEQIIGKRLRELLNVAGSIFYETHFSPLLRMQGFFHEVALDLVRADGTLLPMLANAAEKRDADGRLLFTRVALFQAKDRRRYERELVEARAAAAADREAVQSTLSTERELGKLREQFIAVLGHDLRNPLASIDAAGRMLLREPQTERSRHVIELMQGSLRRMSDLIDNVLDFARGRLGGGMVVMRNADEPLEPVLLQVIEELQSAFPNRAIVHDVALAAPVECDRMRIAQLVSNLLGNAITHGAPDEDIRLQARAEDGMFELWVANGGEPIPEETMAHLFQPFFRGDVGARGKGLGLGLHIASEIARAHGGEITVQSSDAEVRFTFRMPLRQASDPDGTAA